MNIIHISFNFLFVIFVMKLNLRLADDMKIDFFYTKPHHNSQNLGLVQSIRPRGYKTFFKLSSAELSMKFQLPMNVETVSICGKFRFKTQKIVIYPAHKCLMPTIDKF